MNRSLYFVVCFAVILCSLCCGKTRLSNIEHCPDGDTVMSVTSTDGHALPATSVDSIYFINVAKGEPPLRVEVWGDTSKKFHQGRVKFLRVYDSSGTRFIQTIDSTSIENNSSDNENSEIYFTEVHFDDYNFDGCTDIFLLKECGAHSPCVGFVLCYNKIKKVFEHRADYNLGDIQINKNKKWIYAGFRSADDFSYSVYTVKNNKLYLLEEESQFGKENSKGKQYYRYTYQKRVNRKMKTILNITSYRNRFPRIYTDERYTIKD